MNIQSVSTGYRHPTLSPSFIKIQPIVTEINALETGQTNKAEERAKPREKGIDIRN